MFIDTAYIREEFNELSLFNFSGNKSIGVVFRSFYSTDTVKGFSVKTFSQKSYVFGMRDMDKIKEFYLCLMEYGNIEHCRKMVKIGRTKALKIIHILNEECLRRNLPLVYEFKSPKYRIGSFSDNQVSIMKYLYHKGYSGARLAKIYNSHQSTINAIMKGQFYKKVQPIIKISGDRIKPIFANKGKVYSIKPSSLDWLTDDIQSRKIFEYIIWENKPTCPKCKSTHYYNLLSTGGFKCGNKECHSKFSAIMGTPFENTKVKPSQWLTAMSLYQDDNKISTHKISELLNTTLATAWSIKKRVKEVFHTPIWQRFYLLNKTIN